MPALLFLFSLCFLVKHLIEFRNTRLKWFLFCSAIHVVLMMTWASVIFKSYHLSTQVVAGV